jgi:hypothetical protein
MNVYPSGEQDDKLAQRHFCWLFGVIFSIRLAMLILWELL